MYTWSYLRMCPPAPLPTFAWVRTTKRTQSRYLCLKTGPRGLTLLWWGCYGLCQRHKQTELPFLFILFLCVFLSLWPFLPYFIPKNSRQLSAFSLCSSGLISALLVLSTTYLFMKVSLSPDIIFCGWLGLKYQITTSQDWILKKTPPPLPPPLTHTYTYIWTYPATLPQKLEEGKGRHEKNRITQPSAACVKYEETLT